MLTHDLGRDPSKSRPTWLDARLPPLELRARAPEERHSLLASLPLSANEGLVADTKLLWFKQVSTNGPDSCCDLTGS